MRALLALRVFPERLTRHTLVFFAPLIVVGLALVVARSIASLVV